MHCIHFDCQNHISLSKSYQSIVRNKFWMSAMMMCDISLWEEIPQIVQWYDIVVVMCDQDLWFVCYNLHTICLLQLTCKKQYTDPWFDITQLIMFILPIAFYPSHLNKDTSYILHSSHYVHLGCSCWFLFYICNLCTSQFLIIIILIYKNLQLNYIQEKHHSWFSR